MRKIIPILALAVICAAFSAPLLAHHGAAAFDTTKKYVLKGTVTEWLWSNPHCLLQFDVTGDDGKVVHWIGETQNPVTMVNGGWSKFSFKKGDKVTVTIEPVKSDTRAGRIVTVLMPDGSTLNASAGVGPYR
jgi:Family of unknown function (DUF6152)